MSNVVYISKDGILQYMVFHDPESKSVITFTNNHINYQDYKCDCYCAIANVSWYQYIEK